MKSSKKFKNILIVRTDRIGDVVLTTPVMKALRLENPKARISILVTSATQDLIVDNPYLDEIIVDDRKGRHKGLNGFFKLVSEIRKKKYDTALILHTKRRTNALCFLAGIPRRIGYKNNKFGFLLTHPITDTRHQGKKHEAQYCLETLKVLEIESKALDINISVKKKSKQWVEAWCKKNNIKPKEKFIVIHPGASDPSKCWAIHRFVELIDAVCEKYAVKIIIIGEEKVKDTAQQIIAQSSHSIFDLTGQTTVSQLVSVLKRAHLLISNDSGPVHIASGVKTPVISIFTRNQLGINPERWKPLGKKSRTIAVPVDTSVSFKKSQKIDSKYAEKIKAEEVLEAVDELI